MLLGIAYRGVGSPDLLGETIAEFRQALDVSPGFVPPRFFLAQVYLDLGRAERAREQLEAGLVHVPGNRSSSRAWGMPAPAENPSARWS